MPSAVWNHFTRADKNGKPGAKCNKCSLILGANTTGLRSHALSKHGIVINKDTVVDVENDDQPSISAFLSSSKETLQTEIAKLCAVDGISFEVIAKSPVIPKALNKLGLGKVPSSPETIRSYVMTFANEVKLKYKSQMKQAKAKVGLFSISMDEWTSMKNKRYMNIIVHSHHQMWNLGLVRIFGKTSHALATLDIQNRLEEYDLNLSYDFMCLISDAASMNAAIARESGLCQQRCLAHGLQLAIKEVLYDSKENFNESIEDLSDEEDELGELAFDSLFSSTSTEFKSSQISTLINKVRKTVKMFRKSPVKNDLLEQIIISRFGKALVLVLDCKTRWNSLSTMLSRFHQLKECIDVALIRITDDLKEPIVFTTSEYNCINSIASSLQIIELALKAICKKECSLYDAHVYIEVMLDKLSEQNSSISNELKESIISQLSIRFSPMYYIQIYLSNVEMIEQPKYFEMRNPETILSAIQDLVQIIETTKVAEEQTEQPSSETDINTAKGKRERESLMDEFYHSASQKKMKLVNNFPPLDIKLNDEIYVHKTSGFKGPLLEKVFSIVSTIRPTSVDCERTFSIAGLFCNKLRSRMTDITLDNLVLLKSYFNNNDV